VETELLQLPRAQFVAYRTTTGFKGGYLEQPNNLLPYNYLDLLAQIWRPYNAVSPISRPGGDDSWNAAINRARASRTPEEVKKNLRYFARAMYEEATVMGLFSRCEPIPIDKSVHDTDMAQLSSFFMWSPNKTWLSK
jgi:hypothetical protein